MSTPSTIGMIMLCAYCSSITTATTARTVSAALRTSTGDAERGSRIADCGSRIADRGRRIADSRPVSFRKLLGLQGPVDGDRGLHAFRRRDDDKLRVTRSIPGHEHARDIRVAQRSSSHRAAVRQRAAEPDGEIGLWMLAGSEEDDVALDPIAGIEGDRRQQSVPMLEACDRFSADGDAVARETFTSATRERRAVRTEHHVSAPRSQRQRQSGRLAPATERGEAAVAALPPVAVRTMKDRAAVAFLETADAWQIVDDAGGDQEKPRLLLAAVRERDAVMIVGLLRSGDADAAHFDAVRWQLTTPEIVELRGRDAIAREVAVQRARSAIARLADVADQDPPAAPSEHQRRAQSRRSASNDDDVIHTR